MLLHVITSMRAGGAERLVAQMMPRLRDAGIECELALLDGTQTPFLTGLESEGITVHRLGTGLRGIYNPIHIVRLRRLMRRASIVHTHNSAPQIFAAAAACGGRRPVMVTTEHNTTNRRRHNPLWRAMDRMVYGRYDAVVCCSPAVESSLLEHLGERHAPGRVLTITNGIDLTPYMALRPKAVSKSGYIKLLMVSAFRPQKDHITALEALARLPHRYRLIFAGDGETRPQVKEYARRLGLRSRVEFAGNVEDVPSLYADAHISLLSTHYEGLSLTTIEAMASGVPLIASDVAGVSENTLGGALLVDENDPVALAEAIQSLADDPQGAAQLGECGRQTAARYNIDNTVKQYINLYDSL